MGYIFNHDYKGALKFKLKGKIRKANKWDKNEFNFYTFKMKIGFCNWYDLMGTWARKEERDKHTYFIQ